MAVWPLTLPQVPLVAGYRETFEDRRIVAQTETGPGKVRPRSSIGLRVLSMSFYLTEPQRQTLETFYRVETKAGELSFDYVQPRTKVAVQPRFIAEPKFAPARPDLWKSDVAVELLVPTTPLGSLTWPASLPSSLLLDGYDEQMAPLTIKSDGSIARTEIRRRTTATATPIRGQLKLLKPQAVTFERFFEGDTIGGALPFTWAHPVHGSVRFAFAGAPELNAVDPKVYAASVDLEVLVG
jgi:hypothetical protein